jgi:hypothetical protein
MEFLDFTSLTLNEFQQLVPPFETAFHTRMAAWRMDGKPRTARRFTVEFIPLSFWYDTPLISRDSDRRHDPWLVYGSPSYNPARWSSWISRA